MMPDNETLSQKNLHGNQSHRKNLCEEHPYGDVGQIIALILFLIIWALDSFIFKISTMPANYIPLAIRLVLAGLCFLIAVCFVLTSHKIIFEEHRDPPRVIDTGLFSLVRHPSYLSALLIYVGFFFTTLSLSSLLLLICIFLFYDFIARFEEKKLQEAFGEAYTSYKKKTPKWFPRIRAQHKSSP
jgi:protein-S-isoprenylcysteine O-methyltransferase Ste14